MDNNISPSGITSATYHWLKTSANDIKTKGNNISLKQQKYHFAIMSPKWQ